MNHQIEATINRPGSPNITAARPWYVLWVLLLLVLQPVGAQQAGTRKSPEPMLAVIDIVNNTGEFKAFISGLPDMLITELLETGNIKLVERTKIQTAMKALQIETSGLTRESNLELGKWLGVDKIVVGAFNRLGSNYRLDIRIIEVANGKISHAVSATRPKGTLLEIVTDVGDQLRYRLGHKPEARPVIKRPVKKARSKPKPETHYGHLQIEYKMIVGIFAQVAIPFQRVKIYLDNNLIHTSPVIDTINSYFTLFNGNVPAGKYKLTLVHGTVDKYGRWIRSMNEQPKTMLLDMSRGDHPVIKYRMRAEDRWNTFSSLSIKW